MEQAAQGGGVAPIPGGVQETFRCGTKEHDLVCNTGNRWMVGLDDHGGLFQRC